MTAEAYAAAEGLVERSAAAYVAGVPEYPADDGYFGPASVTWRVAGDLGRSVAGLRALMLQALHPLAMAGVDQHSNWRSDPVGRLAATSGYLATISFGDRAAAGRGQGAPGPRAHHRDRHDHRPPVRGERPRPAALGARDPGRVGHRGGRVVRHSAAGRRQRPLRGGDDRRGGTRRRTGRPGPRQPRRSAGLPGLGPPGTELHTRGGGVNGLPARPARPR